MSSVLFVSLEPFAPLMAGPAVRCRELAVACVNAGLEVTIAVPDGELHVPPRCGVVRYDPADDGALAEAAADASAIVVQGTALARFPALHAAGVPVAVDLYCPFLIENLERDRHDGTGHGGEVDPGATAYLNELRGLNTALAHGDFFLCADPRQRDYWLGALTALHRLSPATYRDDPSVQHLIATVPFGCPSDPPEAGAPVLRGVVEGIGVDADIILWAGSLSPWFDLTTLIRAFAALRMERPTATLVLLGSQHPNPEVPASPTVEAARKLAQECGLLDAGVHFLPWVPYAERGAYLREAALGVSTHAVHLEAHFAFRTRLVDYMWAGVPMVLTRGDTLGTRCAALGAAITVEPENVDALTAAMRRGLEDAPWRERAVQACARLAGDYTWEHVSEPLRAWLTDPRRAADAAGRGVLPVVLPPAGFTTAEATAEEVQALRAEAERALELDARLRSLDRKILTLLKIPGVAKLLKARRKS